MAKYFIHNGEQDSIIAELPAGYTVLDVNSAERSAAIDPLENVDVVGVPSIIEEIDLYKNITEEKHSKWICIYVDSASTWAQFEAEKTQLLEMNTQQHEEEKAYIAAYIAANS